MNHSNEVLPTQYKDSSSILSGFLISLNVIRVSCRWREQPTVDFFPHAAAHELSQQGSWDWAQSCVWSLCWQNEATSSMQLTWKLFIPKTPWCHQSGVDEPWPLTALLETNKQTSKQQQQLHKGPNGRMFFLRYLVLWWSIKQQKTKQDIKGAQNIIAHKTKRSLSNNCNQAVSLGPLSKKTFHTQAKNNSLWIAYESPCGHFHYNELTMLSCSWPLQHIIKKSAFNLRLRDWSFC